MKCVIGLLCSFWLSFFLLIFVFAWSLHGQSHVETGDSVHSIMCDVPMNAVAFHPREYLLAYAGTRLFSWFPICLCCCCCSLCFVCVVCLCQCVVSVVVVA